MSKRNEDKKRSVGKRKSVDRLVFAELILTLLCLALYLTGIEGLQRMKAYDRVVTFLSESPLTYEGAGQMRKSFQEMEETPVYTLWGNAGRLSLENRELKRACSAEVYLMEGRSDLVFASDAILDNSMRGFCLMGKDIAEALFGSEDATGLDIVMDGQIFTVTGMLKDAKESVVFLAEDLPDGRLERMNVLLSDFMTVSALKQELLLELGFSGSAIDYRFMNAMVGFMAAGLGILMGLYLFRRMKRELSDYHRQIRGGLTSYEFKYGDHRAYYKGMAVRAAGLILLLVILLSFILKTTNIPEDMIPTKWSDLDFFKRLYEEKASSFMLFVRAAKYDPDMTYLNGTVSALSSFTVAYVCYLMKVVIEHFSSIEN